MRTTFFIAICFSIIGSLLACDAARAEEGLPLLGEGLDRRTRAEPAHALVFEYRDTRREPLNGWRARAELKLDLVEGTARLRRIYWGWDPTFEAPLDPETASAIRAALRAALAEDPPPALPRTRRMRARSHLFWMPGLKPRPTPGPGEIRILPWPVNGFMVRNPLHEKTTVSWSIRVERKRGERAFSGTHHFGRYTAVRSLVEQLKQLILALEAGREEIEVQGRIRRQGRGVLVLAEETPPRRTWVLRGDPAGQDWYRTPLRTELRSHVEEFVTVRGIPYEGTGHRGDLLPSAVTADAPLGTELSLPEPKGLSPPRPSGATGAVGALGRAGF